MPAPNRTALKMNRDHLRRRVWHTESSAERGTRSAQI